MWSNKYIGIPYLDNGRDEAGTDCWGLVRLIYKNEFDIELPSFYTDYAISDTDRIAELMNQYREGWERLALPEEGCIVLFNILGQPSHVGIMLDDNLFIHTRRKQEASIERINSLKWEKRIEGFYKYTTKTYEKLKELPIALNTKPLELPVGGEFTVGNAYDAIYKNELIDTELKDRVIVFLDDKQVFDNDLIIKEGQKLEYRLIPSGGQDTGRLLLTVIVVAAAMSTGGFASAWAGSTGAFAEGGAYAGMGLGLTGFQAGVIGIAAQMGVMMVGMMLVNAIAPIRPPDAAVSSSGMDSSNPQTLLNGSRNAARQYESIPVVLGKYRMIPPVAAINYLTVDTDTSYLKMLLCWGYGPVKLDDIRVGPTLLSNYLDDVQSCTVYGTSSDDLTQLYDIYGTDTSQLTPNIEIPYTEPSGNNVDYLIRTINTPVDSISVSIHFPQGLRGMDREGGNAGNYYAVPFSASIEVQELDPTTLLPLNGGTGTGAWIAPALSFLGKSLTITGAACKTEAHYDETMNVYWSYTHGYVNNLIYLSEAGDLGIITGPAYAAVGNTVGVTGYTPIQVIGGYIFKTGDPYYVTYPSLTYGSVDPTLPINATLLYRIVSYVTHYGNEYNPNTISSPTIVSTQDLRTTNGITSGGAISYANTVATITAGISNQFKSILNYGLSGQPFYIRKDAFTATINFSLSPSNTDKVAPYNVRVKRLSSALFDFSSNTNKPYYYNKAILYLITGTNSYVNAVKPPVNVNLAMSAYKIRATDQLNGSIEGINAIVSSICLDYKLSSYTAVTTCTLTTVSGTKTITITDRTQWATLANKIYVGTILSAHSGFSANATVTSILDNATTIVVTFDINATSSIADSSYNLTNNLWVADTTSNPAALFRYVLQHPANIQAISAADAYNKIDIAGLQDWYTYCDTNGFRYNGIVVQHRSLLEVLKDIAAAGRASPTLMNGKWGVVIDRPRSTVVQHFTPHNSWGFEGTRVLSTPPHALRVNYINELDEYQTNELTVYSFVNKVVNITTTAGSTAATTSVVLIPAISTGDLTYTVTITSGTTVPAGTTATVTSGSTAVVLSSITGVTTGTAACTINVPYTKNTATLFETIQLPGVTDVVAAIKHTKFNIAQAMLRPEMYTISTDMEHLVCTRGDLVKVTHDIPLWGISSGRIKNYINSTTLELSEPVSMQAGQTYTMRIRLADSSSIVRNLAPVSTTNYYTTITLASSVTSTEGAPNNLFMFGALNSESADMIVVGIEPASNLTAKITLTDYSPSIYTSDTMFTYLPAFGTQITSPTAYSSNYITSIPVITLASVKSDESVMTISGSTYIYCIVIPYSNDTSLESVVTDVEYRLCLTADTSKSWRSTGTVALSASSIKIIDVIEGAQYSFQLRYIGASGYAGPWTPEYTHTIVGKTNPPGVITGLTVTENLTQLRLTWNSSPEIDVVAYEVRESNTGWGTAGYTYFGSSPSTTIPIPANTTTTWYVRALDAADLYSTTSASVSKTYNGPSAVTISYAVTGTDEILTWNIPFSYFTVDRYEIRYGTTWAGGTVYDTTKATSIRHKVDYSGTRKYWVTAVDISGRYGTPSYVDVSVTVPGSVQSIRADVVDNNALVYWNPPSTGTLPVDRYEVRKGPSWAGYTSIIGSNGNSTFTTVFEQASGTYLYWVAAIDSAGNVGTPTSVTALVNQPPDYVLRTNINSTFAGTKTNALPYQGGLLLPVNTTETWTQHFTTNGYASPQAQITAGNTIYVEPSMTTASYVETYDAGAVIPTTNIVASLSSTVVSGSVAISCQIQWRKLVTDAWTSATAGATTAIASNFQYVQVTYTFTATGSTNLLQVNALNIKLSIKQRTDSGSATVTNGTTSATVNFGYTFIAADTPIVQANYATPVVPVVTYTGGANPTSFSVAFYALSNGALITAPAGGIPFSWTVKGY